MEFWFSTNYVARVEMAENFGKERHRLEIFNFTWLKTLAKSITSLFL